MEALAEAAVLGVDDSNQVQECGPGTGLAAVVNCAAVSSPAECQRDPERSRAIKLPTELVSAMLAFAGGAAAAAPTRPSPSGGEGPPCCPKRRPPLLVQLSTDQVYSGRRELEDEGGRRDDGGAEPDAEAGEIPVESLWREDETERKRLGGVRDPAQRDPSSTMFDDGSDRMRDFDPDSPAVRPVNAYARQKADAELLLAKRYPRSMCMRSSVMYGKLPRDKKAVKGMRFLQFCDEALKRSAAASAAASPRSTAEEEDGTSASFFDDEFRSFVSVTDVAKAVVASVRKWGDGGGASRDGCALPPCGAINVGGPQRLSRAQFAKLVAEARGLDPALVRSVPSSSVARAVPSPKDISMCVDRLEGLLELKPLSVSEALKDMPPEEEEEE